MERIQVIIICLIAIVATCAFCIGLIAMNEQVTTVKLTETCSIDIIGEYNTIFENGMNQIKIFDKFNNKEYKSIVVYCNSKNAGLQDILTFGTFKSFFVGNTSDTGAEPLKTQWNGETVYVIYTGNNITHDNILIISKNRDECIKMYKSIKYNTKPINNTTTTNNEVTINYSVNINTSNNNTPQTLNPSKEAQSRQQSYKAPNSPTSAYDLKMKEGGGNSPTPTPTPSRNNMVK